MRRIRAVSMLSILVVTALAAAALAAEAKMPAKPGKWAITIQPEVPGLPMALPAITQEQCVTEKDLVPQTNAGASCGPSNPKTTGNSVEWTVDCKDQKGGTIKGTGKITYSDSGDSFEGALDLVASGMQMKQKVSGKRLGDCAKEEPGKKAK